MKPLNSSSLKELFKRFDSFKDAQISSLEILSATSIKIMFNVQDASRGYDWIGIEFYFDGVEEAKLIDEKKLQYIDFSEGISLLYEKGLYYCGVGKYLFGSGTKDASCYIRSKSLKYQEIQTNI